MNKFKTLKNKLIAILLMICGIVPLFFDADGTATVLLFFIAVPLFFAREDWVG